MRYRYLESESSVRRHIEELNKKRDYVVLDTETTDKNPRKAELIHVQLSDIGNDAAVMFDASHAHLLSSIKPRLVLHNYKYDFHVLYRHGTDLLSKPVHDIMIMQYLQDENMPSYSLKNILDKHNINSDYKLLFWRRHASYAEAPFAAQLAYGCEDIIKTGKVYQILKRNS